MNKELQELFRKEGLEVTYETTGKLSGEMKIKSKDKNLKIQQKKFNKVMKKWLSKKSSK